MILGYCRCSTVEQTKGMTLKEQERVVRGYAMMQGSGGFDVQIFSDPGVSGSLPLDQRPAGRDLLAAAQKGDYIVVSKLDRIFRNSLDALDHYQRFKRDGINLVLFDLGTEPVTSSRNVTAKLFFTIVSAFADYERERIRERMAEGKRAKADKGGHTGGEAPYGYRIVGEGREARLEAVEEEQAILARIVALKHEADRRDILPQRKRLFVLRTLHRAGVRSRSGRKFQPVQIQRLIDRHANAIQ